MKKPVRRANIAPDRERVANQIKQVAIENKFNRPDDLIKLAMCESGLNPTSRNKTSSARGLFQILNMHKLSEAQRFNVATSTKWTIDKIRAAGYKPWKASSKCHGLI